MDDSISRQAATQTALEFIVEYLGGAFDEDFQKKLIERMNAVPSAQPVRKTGQWIKRKKGALGYNCSCCGKSDISNHFDYCPNCGADMRGGDNE